MRQLFIVIFCCAFQFSWGVDLKYPVSAIPEEFKTNVNAVVREEKMIFKILSQSRANYYVYYAITIFNEAAKSYASEVVGYDKLSKVKSISGSVYDAKGKLVKKLKNAEIRDQSSFDGISLFSDNRLKSFDLAQAIYPYTVEIEYEIEYKFLFYIPGFIISPGEKVAIQQTSYSLQFPQTMRSIAPRYKLLNINQQPKTGYTEEGFETWTWTFENLKPAILEPLGPSAHDLAPQIIVAPSHFEYDGYVGSMNTWDEFGKWIGTLNKGRNVLPDETRQKIKQITEPLKTPEEKIKAVYEYLQSKTRYVSIQLGIGGYQPFEATVVDQMGYGDCKALSNYMVSMLDAAGIKSNYTLIRAGKNAQKLETDFPSSQFNHATVFVPNKNDTIWLECTSQTDPFGYSGTFTGDRKALAITENGAEIVWTPRYTANQNVQSRSAEVFVNSKGDATAKVKTTYSGLEYENGHLNFVLGNQYDDQKKWIQQNTDIPSFDINSFSIINKKNRIPSAIVDLDLTLNRYATASGKRLFITPNLMNRLTVIPEKVENRKTIVVRKNTYTHLDTVRYHVPEVLYPEFLPEPVKIKSRFGDYEVTVKLDQGNILYVRKLTMNKGKFSADSYNELIDFFKSISKADNIKLVFLNKT